MPPSGSPKSWTIKRLVLVDEKDDVEKAKGENVSALKRKRR